jgi:hypothetical protein
MHQHDVTLKVDCDDDNDVMYLSFTPTPQKGARTVGVSPYVIADLTVDGQLLGLELIGPARTAILKAGLDAEASHGAPGPA